MKYDAMSGWFLLRLAVTPFLPFHCSINLDARCSSSKEWWTPIRQAHGKPMGGEYHFSWSSHGQAIRRSPLLVKRFSLRSHFSTTSQKSLISSLSSLSIRLFPCPPYEFIYLPSLPTFCRSAVLPFCRSAVLPFCSSGLLERLFAGFSRLILLPRTPVLPTPTRSVFNPASTS
jgi:hypothetical protein